MEKKRVYPLRNSDCMDREHNSYINRRRRSKTLLYSKKYKSSAILSDVKWQKKRTFLLEMFKPFLVCEKALSKHKEYCNEYRTVKIELPKKGTMLEFKSYLR